MRGVHGYVHGVRAVFTGFAVLNGQNRCLPHTALLPLSVCASFTPFLHRFCTAFRQFYIFPASFITSARFITFPLVLLLLLLVTSGYAWLR